MTKSKVGKGDTMSKAYRLRSEEAEQIKDAMVRMIVEKRTGIRESDVLHALIWKHLDKLNADDVLAYRKEVLKLEE